MNVDYFEHAAALSRVNNTEYVFSPPIRSKREIPDDDENEEVRYVAVSGLILVHGMEKGVPMKISTPTTEEPKTESKAKDTAKTNKEVTDPVVSVNASGNGTMNVTDQIIGPVLEAGE